jgi:DNA helicase-2/ATP-dependent DNA helicase PcrA
MSNGQTFLKLVTEKIKNRLEQLEQTIRDVKQDIHAMNDYYWENYTEMDEYGYENYDNQQALKIQVDANRENKKMRDRLEKMLDAPFFGSVSFHFDEEEEEETFYIGIGNFAERRGAAPLIYDWRAPVSSLFYDYDKGPAFYEAPGGRMEGEVTSKSQYKIRGGRMIYEFESDVKIDYEILQEELGKHGDVKLKNIIRTIQKEQNAIIRNTKDKVMIIQGAAGSGKTSIALHRIAYLLYHDRNNLRSSNVLILSPNSVFADYISHILPELGEENIREMSLDVFAYQELKDTVFDCEDRYHQIEKMIQLERESFDSKVMQQVYQDAQQRYHYKQSKEAVGDLEGFLIELEDRIVNFKDITYRKMTMSVQEIMNLFYDKFAGEPLLSRMDAVMERFVDEYETLYQKLPEEELLFLQEKFDRMYVTKDLYVIYNWFLEEMGFPTLADVEPERRIISFEDVYPMLYLKYRLMQRGANKTVRHLVVDEMQDYSYLQYRILEQLFPCGKTILGDRAQTVESEQRDVLTFLPGIFGRDSRIIRMNKSYRNTLEIAEYADAICPIPEIEYFERHGKAVEEVQISDRSEALQHVMEHLNLSENGFETAAILTLTELEAQEIYQEFIKCGKEVNYIHRDSSAFQKGLTVTTFYLAKGLEFDQVFVMDADSRLTMYQQYQYISATRALHELYVYHSQ